jgi:hypothetical protein
MKISMKQLESLLLHNGTTTDKTLITLPASFDSPHAFAICGMETARCITYLPPFSAFSLHYSPFLEFFYFFLVAIDMISECYYGGRVTDEWDRKCLQHLLSDIFNVKILNPQYKFGESGMYLEIIYIFFRAYVVLFRGSDVCISFIFVGCGLY